MENCRKSIGAIIILLLSTIFVQNANALTFTMELNPTGNEWTNPDVQCAYDINGSWRNSTGTDTKWTCNNPISNWPGDIYGVRSVSNFPVVEGNYYQIQMVLRNNNSSAQTIEPMYWNFYNSEHFTNVGLEMYYIDERGVSQTCTYSSGSGVIQNSTCWSGSALYNHIVVFTVRANDTGNFPFQIGTTSGVLIRGNIQNYTGQYIYTFGMKKITEFKTGNATEQAEEKTEEASNEGETNSNQADSDNQQASQNVIGVISNILGAFGTPAGDCTLPGNLGNLNVGNLNLCQGKPPEIANIINIVGSIIIVYACYRVARNIFRIWITITAFAQGNSKGGN